MRTVSGHIIRSFTSRQNFFIESRAYEWKETFYQILKYFIFCVFCVFCVFNVSSFTMNTEKYFLLHADIEDQKYVWPCILGQGNPTTRVSLCIVMLKYHRWILSHLLDSKQCQVIGILFLRMSSPTVWIFRDDEAQLFNESHIEMAVFYRLTK